MKKRKVNRAFNAYEPARPLTDADHVARDNRIYRQRRWMLKGCPK